MSFARLEYLYMWSIYTDLFLLPCCMISCTSFVPPTPDTHTQLSTCLILDFCLLTFPFLLTLEQTRAHFVAFSSWMVISTLDLRTFGSASSQCVFDLLPGALYVTYMLSYNGFQTEPEIFLFNPSIPPSKGSSSVMDSTLFHAQAKPCHSYASSSVTVL